jgi:hypothetical protein
VFQDGVKGSISTGPEGTSTPASVQPATRHRRFRCKHPTSDCAKSRGQRTRPDKPLRAAPEAEAQRQYAQGQHCFPSVPFQQFQALFNSLSKVLFIFPSRYLFAIGLPPIFSLGWNLPPALSCNPKQLDSSRPDRTLHTADHGRGCHPPWRPLPRDLSRRYKWTRLYRLQFKDRKGLRFPSWAVPASLAVTGGILVSVFSSA